MGRRFHRGFTAAEKTELWDRWKRGESLKAIGRAFGKPPSSIYFLVAPHGGIRAVAISQHRQHQRKSGESLALKIRDALDKPSAGVGNDQLHALEATIDQMAQNADQPDLSSLAPSQIPRISRNPSELTAEATSSETLRTSPARCASISELSEFGRSFWRRVPCVVYNLVNFYLVPLKFRHFSGLPAKDFAVTIQFANYFSSKEFVSISVVNSIHRIAHPAIN